jgi:hypothetical protein
MWQTRLTHKNNCLALHSVPSSLNPSQVASIFLTAILGLPEGLMR